MRKKAPSEFGEMFSYDRIYFSTFDEKPVTVEMFVPGNCIKYINNDGNVMTPSSDELTELIEKAETFSHFTYHVTKEEMIVLDIQGHNYKLYDPEIATATLSDEVDEEFFFCAGNLPCIAIHNFFSKHKCSKFCRMFNLPENTSIDNTSLKRCRT